MNFRDDMFDVQGRDDTFRLNLQMMSRICDKPHEEPAIIRLIVAEYESNHQGPIQSVSESLERAKSKHGQHWPMSCEDEYGTDDLRRLMKSSSEDTSYTVWRPHGAVTVRHKTERSRLSLPQGRQETEMELQLSCFWNPVL